MPHDIFILLQHLLLNLDLMDLPLEGFFLLDQDFVGVQQRFMLFGRFQAFARAEGRDEVVVDSFVLIDLGLSEGELFFQMAVLQFELLDLIDLVGFCVLSCSEHVEMLV